MRKILGWLLSALLLTVALAPVLAPAVSADLGTSGDAPNTVGSAVTVSAGSGTGSLSGVSGDNVDFYKIAATYGQRMTVTVTASPSSGVYFSTLFRSEYLSVADSDFWFYGISSSGSQNATDVGYFYVAVSCASYVDSITYTLNVTVANSENQEDMCVDSDGNPRPGNDAPDSLASAVSTSSGNFYYYSTGYSIDDHENPGRGYLGGYHDTSDDDDFYTVHLNAAQIFNAGVTTLTWTHSWPGYTNTPSAANYDLYLLDENSNVLDSSTNPAGQTDNISYTSTTGGNRYLKIHRVSGHGYYAMSRSFTEYSWAAFSGAPTDTGFDTNSDGLYENLVVTANLSVATAANYALLGQLYDSNNTYQAIAIKVVSLSAGAQTVELKFNGPTLHSLHANGPYRIEIGLYSAGSLAAGEYTSSQTVGGSYDSTTYTTAAYSYTDFASASGTTTTVPPAATTSTSAAVSVANISSYSTGQTISVAENGVASITVTSATASGATAMTVNFETAQPVKSISVTTSAAASSVSVQAEQLSAKPTAVTDPTTVESGIIVSHYLDLSVTPTGATTVSVESATVEFKVLKSWLSSNSIDSATVALMRYNGGQWDKLTTAATGTEDSTYKYYTATTSGFSTFAVTGKAAAAAPSDSTMLIIAGAVILIVVIAAAVFVTKFRKS